MSSPSATDIIRELDLSPHPEGGWYRETFRDTRLCGDGRAASTAIYFLLKAGEVSHWHRIDATEIWFWHAGASLALSISVDGEQCHVHRLGAALDADERPQAIVPAGAWQSAESLGAWTLVSCTVAPGFEFSAFEMAAPDWRPVSPPARKTNP
jgi:predicted cupin superfamily sugar epimerase